MQRIQKNNNLICLSGEVDFHQPCFTSDGKFKINYHGNDRFSLELSSQNINNEFVKRFKELSPKTTDLSVEELNKLLSDIYGKD